MKYTLSEFRGTGGETHHSLKCAQQGWQVCTAGGPHGITERWLALKDLGVLAGKWWQNVSEVCVSER